MSAMRKIEASNIHTSVNHLDKSIHVPASRAQSAYYLGISVF